MYISQSDFIKNKLERAIRYDVIIDYLEGKGTYITPSDSSDLDSPHVYGANIACYNELFKEKPELQLDKLFETEIIKKLSSAECYPLDTYRIFNCIVAQLKLEENGESSFKIEKEQLKTMMELMKKQLFIHQDLLKKAKAESYSKYDEGMYGHMVDESNRFYKETGKKLL